LQGGIRNDRDPLRSDPRAGEVAPQVVFRATPWNADDENTGIRQLRENTGPAPARRGGNLRGLVKCAEGDEAFLRAGRRDGVWQRKERPVAPLAVRQPDQRIGVVAIFHTWMIGESVGDPTHAAS